MSAIYVPNVSVKVEISALLAHRLVARVEAETVNFDVKAKLEEKERKNQMIVVGFNLTLTTKPGIVKFEVEGTVTLTGKDSEINKMLEINPETKMPHVFQRVYQHAYTAMYLLSTILNVPPPPYDLLFAPREGIPMEEINVEVPANATIQPSATQAEPKKEEETSAPVNKPQ
ncbi:MAG: hypothetical protein QW667_00495 [Candidatus Bathyarchaeia archaeon]